MSEADRIERMRQAFALKQLDHELYRVHQRRKQAEAAAEWAKKVHRMEMLLLPTAEDMSEPMRWFREESDKSPGAGRLAWLKVKLNAAVRAFGTWFEEAKTGERSE